MVRRALRLLLAAVVLVGTPAAAAVRLVLERDGRPLELRLYDGEGARVELRFDGRRWVLPATRELPAAGDEGWRVVFWSRGPRVAGYASRYHVVERDGRICAEVLASRWLGRALAPALAALGEIARTVPELGPLTLPRCGGALPLDVVGRVGFPLLISDGARVRLVVRELQFGWRAEGPPLQETEEE